MAKVSGGSVCFYCYSWLTSILFRSKDMATSQAQVRRRRANIEQYAMTHTFARRCLDPDVEQIRILSSQILRK